MDVHDFIRVLEQIPQLQRDTLHEHRSQLEDSLEEYRALYKEAAFLRKKLTALTEEGVAFRKTHERMESVIYGQEQEIDKLQKEIQLLTRQKEEAARRLEAELQHYESDRLKWQQRENELYNEMKRWSLQGRQHVSTNIRRARSATASHIWTCSNTPIASLDLAPKSPIATSGPTAVEGKYARTIRAQDQLLADVRAELLQQKQLLHETSMATEAQAAEIDMLERELADVKQLNASLMEDNESYQILLHEQTVDRMFRVDEEDEEEEEDAWVSAKESQTSLAAELSKVQASHPVNASADWKTVHTLSDEVKTLQEANKALTLYMNKILLKIVDNQQLVDVLNIDDVCPPLFESRPPPVPPKQPARASRPRRSTISSWITTAEPNNSWTRALKRMTVIGWPASNHCQSNLSKRSSMSSLSLSSSSSGSKQSFPHELRDSAIASLSDEDLME